jgi:SAM-dependent methyltransferase
MSVGESDAMARHAYVAFNERPFGGHQLLLKMVGAPTSVLDVGCSSGYLAARLAAKGVRVVGIELDPLASAEARRFCDEVIQGDVESVPLPTGPFDAIICGDLIEHLGNPVAFMRRVRPLLRPHGRLILTTPNVANLAMRLGLLAGRWRYTDRGILDKSHRHLFTKRTLDEALHAAGYRIVARDLTAPVPLIGTPTVERVAHRIAHFRPSLLAYQFLIAATPEASGLLAKK